MAHTTNIISSIKLPGGGTYEIHDAQAIHSIEELGLSAALVFAGTKDTEAQILAITNAKVGEVYLAKDTNSEFVCVTAIEGTASASSWEKLGNIHDAASSTHTHGVTVEGSNAASTVTGNVTVPTVSKTQKYMTVAATAPEVTNSSDSVLGASTTFNVSGGAAEVDTTKLSAVAAGAAVGADGTASVITGLGTPSTAAAITELSTATIKNPTVTAVSIPNVVKNTSVKASKVESEDVSASKITSNTDITATKISNYGTAASWGASVVNGVLEFAWTANTIPTGSDVTASKVAASDVTASVVVSSDVDVSKVDLGDPLSVSSVSTADVTVATGSKSTANAVVGFNAPVTATVLTGVKMTAQPTVTLSTGATGDVEVVTDVTNSAISVASAGNDNVTALTEVEVGVPGVSLTNNASSVTGSVPVVSGVEIGSTVVDLQNGSAAAQVWTQSSGTTGIPQ